MRSSMEGPAETWMLNTYCFISRVPGLTQKVNFGRVHRTCLVQGHPFRDMALRPGREETFPAS